MYPPSEEIRIGFTWSVSDRREQQREWIAGIKAAQKQKCTRGRGRLKNYRNQTIALFLSCIRFYLHPIQIEPRGHYLIVCVQTVP